MQQSLVNELDWEWQEEFCKGNKNVSVQQNGITCYLQFRPWSLQPKFWDINFDFVPLQI